MISRPLGGLTRGQRLPGGPPRWATAKRFFDGLSYSNKQRLVPSVEGAKTEETRQRRIAKAVDGLREGRA